MMPDRCCVCDADRSAEPDRASDLDVSGPGEPAIEGRAVFGGGEQTGMGAVADCPLVEEGLSPATGPTRGTSRTCRNLSKPNSAAQTSCSQRRTGNRGTACQI